MEAIPGRRRRIWWRCSPLDGVSARRRDRLDTFTAVFIQGKSPGAEGDYLWQQDAPVPDRSGLR